MNDVSVASAELRFQEDDLQTCAVQMKTPLALALRKL